MSSATCSRDMKLEANGSVSEGTHKPSTSSFEIQENMGKEDSKEEDDKLEPKHEENNGSRDTS